jgi:hypothetical protein
LVIPADDSTRWSQTIDELLNDEPRLQRMSRTAAQRMTRFAPGETFEHFWSAHVDAVTKKQSATEALIGIPS